METVKSSHLKIFFHSYKKTKAFGIPWFDLKKWFEYQEELFEQTNVKDDEKINQIVLNLDIRHWKKLNKILKSNLQPFLTYQQLKSSLLVVQPVEKKVIPKFKESTKYDNQINGFVDKLNLSKINFESFLIWLKRLRGICSGSVKDDYLTYKILNGISENNKLKVVTNLLIDLKSRIGLVEKQKKENEKNKELARLILIKETIKNFLDNI